MKFSEQTLTVLKSFSQINKSILLKPGKVIRTIAPEKTLMAKATIPDEIPAEACIYDMSRFLSILSLYDDPEVNFNDKFFEISQGKRKTKYVYADVSMIHAPAEKDIKLPSKDLVVDVKWNDLQSVLRAASVLQFTEIAFVGDGETCSLTAIDSSNEGADTFGVEIGETSDTFKFIFRTDNLKLLPLDYSVTICAKGVSEFKGENVTYHVAIESKSTYSKGE